jgi:WD40 repeat protein
LQAPQYTKALTGHQARVLSVDWRDDVLVSGGADSAIIVWTVSEGTQRSVISVDTNKQAKTLVWQVNITTIIIIYVCVCACVCARALPSLPCVQ